MYVAIINASSVAIWENPRKKGFSAKIIPADVPINREKKRLPSKKISTIAKQERRVDANRANV